MTNEPSQPNYEDKFNGAYLGMWFCTKPKTTKPFNPEIHLGIWATLKSIYILMDKTAFLGFYEDLEEKSVSYPESLSAQAAVVAARATLAMCRQEIMPEDLMSLAIDYLPPGLMDDNPLRARLLVAQDYLEERQTLVDNIEAGDLEIDVLGVDIRNMKRCASAGEIAGEIAAAFYAITARKTSFEEAVELALKSESSELTRLVVGAISGGQHGFESIPVKYYEGEGYGLRQTWNTLVQAYSYHNEALQLAGREVLVQSSEMPAKAEKIILERTGRDTLE
jgi:hypothetical protein